ncbi:hypothetical protein [Hymenobacter yonginensis]|uniref:Quinol oxidase subunit 4 n=1 Tax=Hymenobacter yonginensis TaxID=748197 RepID=A0ABY7PLA8_9BACT|nr:hypothetical protein [Hymenobacter yonginensis]WBO83802.1 hypothetical protein O9Z63_15645 [Hymenobacter yonginensis]
MKPLVTLCLLGTLLVGGSCHRYALPSPKGPPQPKLKRGARATDANADGTAAAPAELKPQKNSYDKNGLLKKPKYERRRVQRKVGQRKFLGITLPF